MFMLGRLSPGIDIAAARAETAAIATELERAHPENDGRGVHVEPLEHVVFSEVRPALLLLLAAVVIVLLVACANVANLLLARGAYRSREVALRASIGADGRRLARLFLTEGLLLALAGGAGGVLLAVLGTDVLLSLAPAGIPRLDAVGVDAGVLAVTLIVSTAVGIAFGLVPVLQARRVDLQTALRTDAGKSAGPGRLRSVLVVTELALAVVLVIGAGLMLSSFWQIRQVDPGFRAEGVLKAEFQLPESRYPVDFSVWPDFREMHAFNAALLERAAALPGVEHAALASSHPLHRGFTNSFSIVGSDIDSSDVGEISLRFVSPGYFHTVRVPVARGRGFNAGDATDSAPVAIVNEAAAKRLFPDRDPLGQRIVYWGDERRIVGVVANEKFHGLTAAAPMAVYTPLAQTPPAGRSEALLVRTGARPDSLAAAVRAAIRETDAELAVFGVEPLRETLGQSIAERRFTMLLLGLFAGVAIVLAAVGIHGVLSYVVARRTPEIGLRMALGASRGHVLGAVMMQGARLAVAGLALGIAGALVGGRLLESQLYGVTSTDPLTFAAVSAGVLGVALLSCWFPARRATTIDPMTALREE
jgi:predicted permease